MELTYTQRYFLDRLSLSDSDAIFSCSLTSFHSYSALPEATLFVLDICLDYPALLLVYPYHILVVFPLPLQLLLNKSSAPHNSPQSSCHHNLTRHLWEPRMAQHTGWEPPF